MIRRHRRTSTSYVNTSAATEPQTSRFRVAATVECQRRYVLRDVIADVLGFLRPELEQRPDGTAVITFNVNAFNAELAEDFARSRVQNLHTFSTLDDMRICEVTATCG